MTSSLAAAKSVLPDQAFALLSRPAVTAAVARGQVAYTVGVMMLSPRANAK